MPCIVALIEKDVVYCAADSLLINIQGFSYSHVSQTIQETPKVWVKDGMVFAGHGDQRMLQLVHYEHGTPSYPAGQDKVTYLVSTFIPSLRKCFSLHEYRSDAIDGEILLSIENQLFIISSEFQVCDPAWAGAAVGQGAPIAEGSLYTTEQLTLPPLPRLYLALFAAEKHTDVVSRPFMYITNEMKEPALLNESVLRG